MTVTLGELNRMGSADFAASIGDTFELAPWVAEAAAARRPFAKVTALHPVSVPAHGAALNITVQSYMDALNFGLTADRRAVPDVGKLGDYMVAAANELKTAVVPG